MASKDVADPVNGLKFPNLWESRHCGNTGIWVEILGQEAEELNDNQRSPSFLCLAG